VGVKDLKAAAPKAEQARAESVPLSRDGVLAGALAIVNREGVERLTIRRLADALGVSPMAIYRHVANKADLLDGTLDLLMRQARVTDHDEDDWRDWLCETFLRMRMTLIEQRGALALIMTRASLGPQALAVVEEVLARLDRAGLQGAEAARIFQHLMMYTLGSIALLAPVLSHAPELVDPEERLRRVRANFEVLSGKQFPQVTRHAAELAAILQDDCFVAEIRRIAEGAVTDPENA
jgi:AcrR family transcriptional regulator